MLGHQRSHARMPDLTDQQHERFLRLFVEHEAAVRTFVRSLLPYRSDAAEVMQDVAVVLWQKFAEFDAARDFRKWAFGVARFEALAYLRDRARDRHVFDDELVGRLADEASLAERRHELQREALETCLLKLPETERALVLAAYAQGTRIDELAAQCGQTAMSLYKVLHRIRQALLECMRRAVARGQLS
jgi:RNA polymerase sigma-70 factor (ECF subfamily)